MERFIAFLYNVLTIPVFICVMGYSAYKDNIAMLIGIFIIAFILFIFEIIGFISKD